ncbi:hypothetical protein [Paenibacillus sp. IHBB 3054]|uniref:hypothetical protein n=1 Tax=Paenibacillus sp. IHBB 3054 TaxID=3425689 RepID=UPI003F66D84F
MGKKRTANPSLCTSPNCSARHYAKGYCKKHYSNEWYKNRAAAKLSQTLLEERTP